MKIDLSRFDYFITFQAESKYYVFKLDNDELNRGWVKHDDLDFISKHPSKKIISLSNISQYNSLDSFIKPTYTYIVLGKFTTYLYQKCYVYLLIYIKDDTTISLLHSNAEEKVYCNDTINNTLKGHLKRHKDSLSIIKGDVQVKDFIIKDHLYNQKVNFELLRKKVLASSKDGRKGKKSYPFVRLEGSIVNNNTKTKTKTDRLSTTCHNEISNEHEHVVDKQSVKRVNEMISKKPKEVILNEQQIAQMEGFFELPVSQTTFINEIENLKVIMKNNGEDEDAIEQLVGLIVSKTSECLSWHAHNDIEEMNLTERKICVTSDIDQVI